MNGTDPSGCSAKCAESEAASGCGPKRNRAANGLAAGSSLNKKSSIGTVALNNGVKVSVTIKTNKAVDTENIGLNDLVTHHVEPEKDALEFLSLDFLNIEFRHNVNDSSEPSIYFKNYIRLR